MVPVQNMFWSLCGFGAESKLAVNHSHSLQPMSTLAFYPDSEKHLGLQLVSKLTIENLIENTTILSMHVIQDIRFGEIIDSWILEIFTTRWRSWLMVELNKIHLRSYLFCVLAFYFLHTDNS